MLELARLSIHKDNCQLLQNLLPRAEKPHVLLFYGPSGVGKKTTAVAFAKDLIKSETSEENVSLRKLESGNHPDIRVVEPDTAANFYSMSAVKSLISDMTLPPFEAGCRVFVFTNINRLQVAQTNALLKTLEEPADTSYIILVADSIENILPTILSRCVKLKFAPLPGKELARFLVDKKGFSENDAENLADQSKGSISKALQIANSEELTSLEQTKELLSKLDGKAIGYIEFSELLDGIQKSVEKVDAHLKTYAIESLFEIILTWHNSRVMEGKELGPAEDFVGDLTLSKTAVSTFHVKVKSALEALLIEFL